MSYQIIVQPEYLTMNSMAYSVFCSAISKKEKLETIKCPEEYDGMKIIIVNGLVHYNDILVRVSGLPSHDNLSRNLNQQAVRAKLHPSHPLKKGSKL
jgi:hypothetical protein